MKEFKKVVIFIFIICVVVLCNCQSTAVNANTTSQPPSVQGWVEFLNQGMSLLPSSMALEELLGTMGMIPSLDENTFGIVLQSLNIDVPNSSQLSNLMAVLKNLLKIVSWGSTQLPDGNIGDLVSLISTMDEQSLEVLFQSLNVDMLSSTQFADAQRILQDLITSVHGQSTTANINNGQSTTFQPPSIQGWAEFLNQGMSLLPSSMTLEELLGTMSIIPSLDEQTFAGMLQSLNIDVPNSSELSNAMTVLEGLLDIVTWGSSQLPGGNVGDLVNLISNMDENSLQLLLQNLNVDTLSSAQFVDALAIIKNLKSLVSDGNALPPGGNLNDILNMISTMDEQDLQALLQSLNINIVDPSEISGVLTGLKTLQTLISSGIIQLPNGDIDDLLNMMSTLDAQNLAILLQSLNIDGFDPSQLGGAMAVLQSLIASGNIQVPNGDIDGLLNLLSTIDPQILALMLQNLNTDGLDPSQLGGAMVVLQSLIASGNIQIPNGDINGLLNLVSTMDPKTLAVILQSLNIDGLDPAQLGDVMTILQSAHSALTQGNFQLPNSTDFNPLDYLDLSGLSAGCNAGLNVLVSEIKANKTWAFRMIDSWGKLPAGVLDGNVNWLGSYDQCLAIEPDVQKGLQFETNYCVAGNKDAFKLGMCLPKSCAVDDIYKLADELFGLIPVTELPEINYVRCQKEIEYDTKAIVAICVCGSVFVLILFATLFDVILVSPKLRRKAKQPDVVEKNDDEQVENGLSEISSVEKGASMHHVEIKFDTKTGEMKTHGADPGYMYKINGGTDHTDSMTAIPYSGICSRLILSFSVWTNGKRLLNTDDKPDTMGAINGIRFFSMSWVILAHTFSSALDWEIFTNKWSGKTQMLERHSFMAVSNGFLSVDSLFAMSGLLVSYFFMKEMKREKGCINWFKFYIHRVWRLTPPYMLVMMMDIALFRYVGDGPKWSPDGIETDFCKDTWWTNLLYINNFVKSEKRCLSWSWYMTNDMQFYVLSPLLLVPLYLSKKIGGLIVAIFLIGVTGTSTYVSYDNDLPLSRYSSAENTEDYFEMYYIKPYCRMGPYIVGVIIGYVLYRLGGKYKINLAFNRFIWILMSALGCVLLYAIYPEMTGSSTGVALASLYNAVHKTLWGVCVCWVVFACVTGNGGFVNSFLSWGVFVPLRRLTYCAYLVYPLVIASYYGSHRQGVYMTDFNIIYLFLGNLTLTYMVACVIFLAFQAPLMGLERAVLKRDKDAEEELEKQ